MASLFTFKECSSCGAWYNKSCGCSKGGFVDKFVRDPNKTPDSSQRPPIFEKNYPKCGDPVDGLYCRQCALLRKKLREIFDENEFFQDFLNTSESSNDNTNVVNAPQEPFVFNQDPCGSSSQSPTHIDHHCCYECGDSLDDIFCQRYGSPFTYDSTLKLVNDSPNISNPPPQPPTYSYEFCGNDTYYEEKQIAKEQAAKNRYWKIPICYDDDDDEEYTIAIKPDLSTEESDNSLSMGDKHPDTISETESDEVIKSSIEDLVPI
ncbi:hypothetical protein Tco_0867727 [Tanacetum coccineum]